VRLTSRREANIPGWRRLPSNALNCPAAAAEIKGACLALMLAA